MPQWPSDYDIVLCGQETLPSATILPLTLDPGTGHAWSRRTALGLIAAAMAVPAGAAATTSPRPPLVLFVCQAGTVKSAIARELYLKRAGQRSIPAAAFSRGIAPADHLSPELARRLAAKGIDLARQAAQQLTQADLDRADLVILFDPLPAGLKVRAVRDWTAQPGFNDAFDQAWPWLESHVERLLDELSRSAKETRHG